MAHSARVERIDVIKKFREAVCKVAEALSASLEEVDAAIRRSTFWLKDEQQPYWKNRVLVDTELLTRAKVNLIQKQSEVEMLEITNSCVDERQALESAKRRLEESREKTERVKFWIRRFEQEVYTYHGSVQPLAHIVQQIIPKTIARLDQMIIHLEQYVETTAPEPSAPSPEQATVEDTRPKRKKS